MYRYGSVIGIDDVDGILRDLDRQTGSRNFLELSLRDGRVDWSELGVCSNQGLPSIDHGQKSDCRFSRPDGSSLHVHWFPQQGVARFHRDRFDPVDDPIGHLVMETPIPASGAAGGILGYLLTANPWVALGTAVVGAFVGSAASSPTKVWVIEHRTRRGEWSVRQVAPFSCAHQSAYA